MINMNVIYFLCLFVAVVSATEEEDMLGFRQKKDVSEAYKRPATADYRYSGYNGVYDNNNYYNPYTKSDYYNPYNPAYNGNNRFYNRRNYPVDGKAYGPYGASQQYNPAYYNNSRYQYGNYPGYSGPNNNYPAGYNYPYNSNYQFTAGKYPGYNNPGYYQGTY